MYISPVNLNTNTFRAKEDYLKAHGRNHNLKAYEDALKLFDIENISSAKVGSKYIFTPKDPKYKDLRILVKGNSTLEGSDGEKMVDLYRRTTSFTGKVFGSVGIRDNKADDNMKNAYIAFWDKGMLDTINERYKSREASKIKNDYNFFIPSDGDGTRYRDIATLLKDKDGNISTKPATIIPTTLNGEQMRLVQGVLVNFAKTGKVDDGYDFIPVIPAKGSAYAFLEGLKSGKIPTDKSLVFSWGDNFSDIDITKLILDFESTNTGFSYLALPVNGARVASLGAALVDKDMTVSKFKEKPNEAERKEFLVPETKDTYYGVVGPYVMSKEVLAWIKNEYTKDPESFLSPDGKGYDFSSMVLGRLVEPMNKGEITDEGKALKMKVYAKPDRDTWSDLGAEKDLSIELKRDFAVFYKNLPHEMRTGIMKNRDGFGNIFFNQDSKAKYEEFCKEYGVQFLNVIAYDASSV